ncbi:glutaredoxin 3 [Labrys monachus]|uniref:Glutaredoxin n=1 Tax=Labrys monachus TaxID=217067 RepID=A0ABU0FPQ7_9HYPH|nr:glutaredoxin 3 [Labrys monachus]MDQ0396347.1 glutaredoxin 3 [Labrys monachus]
MPPVVIYTKSWCPYCRDAKSLLDKKGVPFQEIDVDGKPDLQAAMSVKAHGRRSVPQIFIGETHVGGCDDLYDLDAAGKLDDLLAA